MEINSDENASDDRITKTKVGILLAFDSPWSIDIACRLDVEDMSVVCIGHLDSDQAQLFPRTKEGLQRLKNYNIEVEILSRSSNRLWSSIAGAAQLRKIVKNAKLDVLLCLYGGKLALLAAASFSSPYAIYWVGSDVLRITNLKVIVAQMLARFAALNIANGHRLSDVAKKRLECDSILPLYIGIDTEYWKRKTIETANRIVCTRWFEDIYDNETIIRAFSHELPPLDCNVVFTSSGSGFERARMLAFDTVKDRGANSVQLLGGVDRDRLFGELDKASVFISMAKSDGTSTALLEAMAMGLFPIVSDIAANREWVDVHGCDCILVPVGDAQRLNREISEIIVDRNRRVAAAIRNRHIVVSVASQMQTTRQLSKLLSDIAAQRQSK